MHATRARARFVDDGLATITGPALVVALYERLGRDLDDAALAIDGGDLSAANTTLVHAQDIVTELLLALDGAEWGPAGELAELYEWLYRELVAANVMKDARRVARCRAVVAPLCDAWAGAAAEISAGRATF